MLKLRLLIVDDHAMFRDGLRVVLEHADDMEQVGEAGDGEAAIRLAAELQPDIVLMDLHMPGLGGVEATRAIVSDNPHVKVIALSMYQDDRFNQQRGWRGCARVHPERCACPPSCCRPFVPSRRVARPSILLFSHKCSINTAGWLVQRSAV